MQEKLEKSFIFIFLFAYIFDGLSYAKAHLWKLPILQKKLFIQEHTNYEILVIISLRWIY